MALEASSSMASLSPPCGVEVFCPRPARVPPGPPRGAHWLHAPPPWDHTTLPGGGGTGPGTGNIDLLKHKGFNREALEDTSLKKATLRNEIIIVSFLPNFFEKMNKKSTHSSREA